MTASFLLMKRTLEAARALAAKNAALLHRAQQTDAAIVTASHGEIDRLGSLIAGAKHGQMITDPVSAVGYVKQVHQRAALLRRVGDA